MAKAEGQGSKHVTVIGAGVVGMGCAAHLQRAGFEVTVIDRVPPGETCSFGNAGGLAVTHVAPLAVPGMIAKLPGWLFDPKSPIAVRWGHLPRMLPWAMRFWRSGARARSRRIAEVQASILAHSYESWVPLLEAAGLAGEVRHTGGISPYRSERSLAHDMYHWRILEDLGLPLERLGAEELRQLEPALGDRYACAMFEPEWRNVLDPWRIVSGLAEHVRERGGTILREAVTGFEVGPEGPRAVRTNRGLHPVGRLVIAAGAWSHRLAARLGSPFPLESGRGFYVTLPDPGVELRHILLMPETQVAVTSMTMGLRFAGSAQFAGIDSPPDYRRAAAILEGARRAFPGINTEGYTEWAGDRPMTPDTVPVIGRSPHFANTFYAFGHGHIGLTMGGVTGRLIAELVAGQPTTIDVGPLGIDRFK